MTIFNEAYNFMWCAFLFSNWHRLHNMYLNFYRYCVDLRIIINCASDCLSWYFSFRFKFYFFIVLYRFEWFIVGPGTQLMIIWTIKPQHPLEIHNFPPSCQDLECRIKSQLSSRSFSSHHRHSRFMQITKSKKRILKCVCRNFVASFTRVDRRNLCNPCNLCLAYLSSLRQSDYICSLEVKSTSKHVNASYQRRFFLLLSYKIKRFVSIPNRSDIFATRGKTFWSKETRQIIISSTLTRENHSQR